ncbi:transposase [Nocardia sp. NPDC004722]
MAEHNVTAAEPNRLRVADATRIPCGQGAFWLAAARDAFSNRIVGRKTSDRRDTELVLGAMEYAVRSREIRDEQLIHHSNRGSTHTAIRFANKLADNGIAHSMGSAGDTYDNAMMENFVSTLEAELTYRRTATRPSTPCSPTSTDGTTPSASRRRWAGDHPTSSSPFTTNRFQPKPDNPLSGLAGSLMPHVCPTNWSQRRGRPHGNHD